MHARERRQLRMFIRRDTYGRYVSVLVYLPRDRYNTNVRERFSADPQGRASAATRVEFTRPGDRVHDRQRPLRRAPAQGRGRSPTSTPPTSSAGSPRPRARGATTSPTAVIDRVRRGARRRAGPAVRRRRSPRPTRRTSSPRDRRGRPRPARGDARQGDEGIDLSLYEQMDAGRGEAPAQGVPDRPAALAVARCCRCCPRWASRSSTSGPTSSTGWTARRTSTSSGCATASTAARDWRASCSRTRCARSGTATTRSTASTRWCSAPG